MLAKMLDLILAGKGDKDMKNRQLRKEGKI